MATGFDSGERCSLATPGTARCRARRRWRPAPRPPYRSRWVSTPTADRVCLYVGRRHPFSRKWLRGGTHVPGRRPWAISLGQQADRSPSGTGRAALVPACRSTSTHCPRCVNASETTPRTKEPLTVATTDTPAVDPINGTPHSHWAICAGRWQPLAMMLERWGSTQLSVGRCHP